MKIVSWNVNGLRSAAKRGLIPYLDNLNPDIICLQETRCSKNEIESLFPSYFSAHSMYSNSGRAGVAILSNIPITNENEIVKGRIIRVSTFDLTIYSVYVPHGYNGTYQQKLELLHMLATNLSNKLKTIVAGDFNIALESLDVHHKPCKVIGCKEEERSLMKNLGLVDAFRVKNPGKRAYTYWSNGKRTQNKGWRLDYILSSQEIEIRDASIPNKSNELFKISDHLPVIAELNL
ncbi:MAG: hypothetical protein D6732_00980 [Methanobacteriota archaeon]|nr:MAG: hypothetical protein D6732_00980 [Euryarchaeota archaeon]